MNPPLEPLVFIDDVPQLRIVFPDYSKHPMIEVTLAKDGYDDKMIFDARGYRGCNDNPFGLPIGLRALPFPLNINDKITISVKTIDGFSTWVNRVVLPDPFLK